ncbi:MAG TPA: hypothetical protein PKE29_08300 [Phycisphaerales bacterium]|nr:hypothetical protein [Phycisphaerales bacterium]
MSVIPDKDLDAVQFFETHDPVWATAPTTIGLTAAMVTSMTNLTKAARDAYTSQQNAKTAAKNATVAWHNAVSAMRANGSDLVATIKAYAMTTNNPNVYTIAQIPPPAAPQPAPAPGQPTNITVGLESSGAITLRWKATNAAANAGTFFSIVRKLSGESMFMLVGNTGEKSWTDVTLAQGTPGATYIIQGHRGAIDGTPSEQIGVQFGVGGGGGVSVSNATLKMAA